MRFTYAAVLILLAAALATGCGPRQQYLLQPELETGQEFDHSIVPFLFEGSTTKGEVRALLGDPFIVDTVDDHDVWYYYYRRVRDRYGEDWTGRIVDPGHDTIEEHAATLVFVKDVLWSVDTRVVPLHHDNPWVRMPDPDPASLGGEFGPQTR